LGAFNNYSGNWAEAHTRVKDKMHDQTLTCSLADYLSTGGKLILSFCENILKKYLLKIPDSYKKLKMIFT
jgi:hypothetical protein